MLGHTVMTRQTTGAQNLDTYYVYDDAGQLRWVVTPEGSALLGTSGTWALSDGTGISDVNTSNAAKYCYIYTWDGLGRQLSRKIPGKAVEYFVYDRAGRLVMTQDGLQRTGGKWVTLRYDNTGHLIRRALLTSSQGMAYFQNLFQSDNYPSGSRQDNGLPVQTSPTANRFRFNGKELQSTGSLGYLNYGARFYDPDIARWNACDVLADVQNGLSPYSFCGGNPILNVDGDGNIFETAWDAVSLVMGVKSFVGNVRQGNVGDAIVDGVGIVGDAISVAAPFVPGGLSAGIAAARIAKNADNVVDAVKAADKAVDAAQGLDNTVGIIDAPKVFSTNKAITKGETFHTALGRKAHNDYNPGEGFIKEYRLPSHKRADAVNEEMGIVKELKPNNKRAIKKGEKQVQEYVDELQQIRPDREWKGFVETYDKW